MTADVDGRSEVSQGQEKCALDISAYEDFSKGDVGDCNGISHPKDNEINGNGAYSSYVLINGSDVVVGDPVHADLNGEGELECFGNATIEINAEFQVAEPKIENVNDANSCIAEASDEIGHAVGKELEETESSEKVEKIMVSQDVVFEPADNNCSYALANCGEDKHDMENRLDSNGNVREFEEPKNSVTHTDAFVPEQNSDAGDKADEQDQDKDSQTADDVNGVNASDDCEVVLGESCASLIVTATNTGIIGVVPLEGHALVLEKTSEESSGTDTCLIDGKDAQAEGSISIDKGGELPTSDEVKASSTSMSDGLALGCQKILEDNRQLEKKDSTSSAVMVGSFVINCTESFPSLPFNNVAIKLFLKAKSPVSQEVSPSSVENVGFKKEIKKIPETIDNSGSSCLLDTKIEAKPENGTVGKDTQSSCLGDGEGNLNHGSDVNEIESNGSTCQEVKVIDEIHGDVSSGTLDCSILDTSDVQNEVVEVGSGPFYFVRIPRYEDQIARAKIKHAESLVDEKTRIRDSFQAQIQTPKAACKEINRNIKAAKSEEREAHKLLNLKLKEIESAKSVINKAKDALSIDDIGIKIHNMEHRIAHETLPLKEEKQLIRDIKQWKQHRDKLILEAGKQAELQLALDQKDEIEERLTVLWKEADLLKANVLKAEATSTSLNKMYDDEKEKFDGFQSQFEAADKIRQEAYVHLQCLRKPLDKKYKYFWKYNNDFKEAKNLALSKDRVKLQRHAINQVETFMEKWNNDEEFRKDYVRCNITSTLRRLETFDGRSLGPGEEAPTLNNTVQGRAATDNSDSPVSTVEQDKVAVYVETVKDSLKPMKVEKKKKKKTKTKNSVAVVPTSPNAQTTVSCVAELVDTRDAGGHEVVDIREEDERSKEEAELAKRAEELKKEEEAIRLKEQQLKLEEKAKAEAAFKRKKRKAEKAQARAAIKAQKEAEEKEKKKEKKAKKNERKMIVGGEARNDAIEEQPDVIMETPTDTQKVIENAEKPKTTSKKSQKRSQIIKQSKAKPIPPPLLKRGKRKMETWMWILLVVVVVVLALFFLGNDSFSSKLKMSKFSF